MNSSELKMWPITIISSNCNRHKNLSLAEYQQEIRTHLKDLINNFKKIDNRWKIQLPTKMFKKNMKCI